VGIQGGLVGPGGDRLPDVLGQPGRDPREIGATEQGGREQVPVLSEGPPLLRSQPRRSGHGDTFTRPPAVPQLVIPVAGAVNTQLPLIAADVSAWHDAGINRALTLISG
jgi:hypothetical protein